MPTGLILTSVFEPHLFCIYIHSPKNIQSLCLQWLLYTKISQIFFPISDLSSKLKNYTNSSEFISIFTRDLKFQSPDLLILPPSPNLLSQPIFMESEAFCPYQWWYKTDVDINNNNYYFVFLLKQQTLSHRHLSFWEADLNFSSLEPLQKNTQLLLLSPTWAYCERVMTAEVE